MDQTIQVSANVEKLWDNSAMTLLSVCLGEADSLLRIHFKGFHSHNGAGMGLVCTKPSRDCMFNNDEVGTSGRRFKVKLEGMSHFVNCLSCRHEGLGLVLQWPTHVDLSLHSCTWTHAPTCKHALEHAREVSGSWEMAQWNKNTCHSYRTPELNSQRPLWVPHNYL